MCSRLTHVSPSQTFISISPFGLLWGSVCSDVEAQACLDARSFLCLDPGPHFAAAGARPDAGSGAPASSGGPGEASGGARARGRGLLAGRHHPPCERRWNQRGHRAAAEGRRCAVGLSSLSRWGSFARHPFAEGHAFQWKSLSSPSTTSLATDILNSLYLDPNVTVDPGAFAVCVGGGFVVSACFRVQFSWRAGGQNDSVTQGDAGTGCEP